ncbi:MAG: 30S ribosomal protein S1 [Fimbriimonadaceae bacterium]
MIIDDTNSTAEATTSEAVATPETPTVTDVPEAPPTDEAPVEAAPVAAPEPPQPIEEPQAAPAEPVAVAPAPEEPAMPAAAPATGRASDEDLFEAAMASMESEDGKGEASPKISKGDRLEAKVIMVERDRVFVDLGTKAEGVVPLEELTDERIDSAMGVVSPGDTFEVIVLKPGSAEGNPIVSKRRADFDQTWQKILDSFDESTVFQAQVIDRVKGGLVVDIGVRGFVPATHVGNGKLRNIEKYVGQVLAVKIIEIDRDRKKVVLSNREAEGERRDEARKEVFDKVKTGDVVPGTVRRLTDYGAFVDLGGVDGLLHISEMSWYRISHPKEVLKEGDDINVQVLRLDSNSGRISLGLRQVLPDPWNIIRENYKIGQKIKVSVGRIVQSGAFVRLPEGAEAFLPLSECSNKRVKSANEAISEGEEIEPTIIDLRTDDRRMVLSLRDGAQPATGERGQFGDRRKGRRGPRPDGTSEVPAATMRAPTGGATIGERLGMLKGILRGDNAEGEPEAEAATPAEIVPDAPKAPAPVAEAPAPEVLAPASEAPDSEAPDSEAPASEASEAPAPEPAAETATQPEETNAG